VYRYIARRLLALIPTLFGVSVVVFLFLRLIPGDPATAILRENATAEQIDALNTRLGLGKPLYEQYFDYITKLLRGDLGEGYFTRSPVIEDLCSGSRSASSPPSAADRRSTTGR
jgi:peptide/nickel transport system permease protein